MYLGHRWKNPPVKFGALQVGKVLSNGETNRPGKNYWKGLSESLHCSSRDIQASFEKAFWRLDPLIKDPRKKELASATLRSIALNYIAKKGPTPPKALLRALKNLKRRDDIIISKLDKGSGVVVMDRDQYLPVY